MRVLALLAAGVLCLSAANELSNRRAPGFALPDLDYKHFYDLQDYRGKVLLIDIMKTGCPHCMLLTTTLEKVKQKYGDKVGILSVVVPPDTPAAVAEYISKNKVTIPVLFDQGQMTVSYFNARPDRANIDVPHLFIIDKNGMIRADYGYKDDDHAVFDGPGLYPVIDKLLK